MSVRLALDGPHVLAVFALEPDQIALGIGGRQGRAAIAVALRAVLGAVTEWSGFGLGHLKKPGGRNYGSVVSGASTILRRMSAARR